MPSQASIPGKPHKPGWAPQKPYVVPDDPMPRSFTGPANVRPEAGLASNTPAGELPHEVPTPISDQSPVPRARTAEAQSDGQRYGMQPRNPDGRFARDPGKFPARVPGR